MASVEAQKADLATKAALDHTWTAKEMEKQINKRLRGE